MATLPAPPVFRAQTTKIPDLQAKQDLEAQMIAYEPEPTALADIIGRSTDQQITDWLGLSGDDLVSFRSNPQQVADSHPILKERAFDLRRRHDEGDFKPAVDEGSNIFLDALRWLTQDAPGISQVFTALEIYDRNIALPTTALTVELFQKMMPGDQQIEARTRELEAEGLRFDRARVQAFEESDIPGWVKGGLRFILDPAMVLGAANLVRKGVSRGVLAAADLRTVTAPSAVRAIPTIDALLTGTAALVKPGINKVTGIFAPSTKIAKGSLEEALQIGLPKARTVGDGLSELKMAEIVAAGPGAAKKMANLVDDGGFITVGRRAVGGFPVISIGGKMKAALNDVIEATIKKADGTIANPVGLDDEIVNFITTSREFIKDAAPTMRKLGVDIDEIPSIEDLFSYFPRKVLNKATGKQQWDIVAGPGISLARKQGFEKSRVFDTMLEGLGQGVDYANPFNAMEAYVVGTYRRMADQQFINWVKASGLTRKGSKARAREGVSQAIPGRIFFDKEVALKIDKFFADKGIPAFKGFSDLNDAIRTGRTTFDFGAPFIQGLTLLARDPVAWGKAVVFSLNAFRSSAVRAKYVRDNANDIAEFVTNGGLIGSSEFTTSLQAGGWLARVPIIREAARPFQRTFESFLDVGKIELYKGLRETAKREGRLPDLANHVNKMLGSIDIQALGVGATQRQIERSMLLFSPQYTRASIGLALDIFQGGLKGDQARKAMASMLFGGMAATRAFSEALGQEPNFDPSSSGYMKVQLGGLNIGPGGKHRSLLRLMARMVESPIEGFYNWNIFDGEDYSENPLLGWMRGNFAPNTQILMSMALGEDGIGRTIPLDDPLDWARFAGQQLLPFSVAAAIEEGQFNEVALAAESFGAIASPVSAFAKQKELRNKEALELTKDEAKPREWEELSIDEKGKLNRESQELKDMTVVVRDADREFTRNKDRGSYFDALDKAEEFRFKKIDLAAKNFDAGIEGRDRGKKFRDELSEASFGKWRERQAAEQSFPEVPESFKKSRDIVGRNIVDVAFEEYFDRVFGPDALDSFGRYSYIIAEQQRQALRGDYGNEIIDQVEAEIRERKRFSKAGELPDSVLDFYDATDTLKPFFEAYKTVLSGADQEFWKAEYLSKTDAEREELATTDFRIRFFLARIKSAQQRMQRSDQDIDTALVRFYDRVPRHPANVRRLR